MKTYLFILSSLILLFSSCTQPKREDHAKEEKNTAVKPKKVIERKKPDTIIYYQYVKAKKWLKEHKPDAYLLHLITTINRTDSNHLSKMDSIIIPSDSSANISYYLPFPVTVKTIANIDKVIFFSYPAQTFAAYENGEIVYTGATNMGRKNDQTPTGLFFTNWKAETTTSTFNDEWELKWNFNIANKLGIGWHQYEMPGYPASHSCLRLQEEDARYLYSWADQWVLNKKEEIELKGTPVIVFGSYDFNGPKPWKRLITDPHALDIPETEIERIVSPYLQEITIEQNKRRAATTSQNDK